MQLINYSERSFVIFGDDTSIHKELIKTLGGRWNRNLTHPITNERFGGWVFSNRNLNAVSNALREYMTTSMIAPSAPFAPVSQVEVVYAPVSQVEVIPLDVIEEEPEEENYPVKQSYVFSNTLFMCFVFALCYVIG